MKRGAHPNVALIACALIGLTAGMLLTRPLAGSPPSELGSMSPARYLGADYLLPRSYETERPPLRRQGAARAIVEFIEPEAVENSCRIPGALACARMLPGKPTIVLPNPCEFAFDDYAALACHELGHVHGWEHKREGEL